MTQKGVVRGQQDDGGLKLSFDRKVSPTGIWQESRRRWVATTPNSFGLPSGVSCPGATPFCGSCYGERAERSAGVTELLHHNLELLDDAGTMPAMAGLIHAMLCRYEEEADRRRLAPADRLFRIHWDGDFFSIDYARAWVTAIRCHPDVSFWCYTRSFRDPVDVIPTLAPVPNLTVYLSVDDDNRDDASRYPDLPVAWCAVDYNTARDLASERPRIPAVCPENAGRIPLMGEGRGACVDCRICPDGRRDILFSTSHRDNHLTGPSWQPVILGPAPSGPNVKVCEWCLNPFEVKRQRGRVPRFCQRACQLAAYHARVG